MAKYKVKREQNLYDVALHLYGTIEGLFDLLISNPSLNMQAPLVADMELEYHDDFVINPSIVNQFTERGIVPVNGERNVYYKDVKADELRAIIKVPSNADSASFSVSGAGVIVIDWGDNTPLESIQLTDTPIVLEHYFNDSTDSRRVKIYGDFAIQRLDTTALDGEVYLTKPLIVGEYTSRANSKSLDSLFLFEDTYKVDLQNAFISDLSPIYDMSLSQLDLSGVRYQNMDVLDDYLTNIVENYNNRQPCEVWLNITPSERGMQAIQTILNNPTWNAPSNWVFHINDVTYPAPQENIGFPYIFPIIFGSADKKVYGFPYDFPVIYGEVGADQI